MKLHVYDHCPYCVRARMPFGLKDIPFTLLFQSNDDEATPISMIGEKMLPILEDEDGYMAESLDIVEKLDRISGPLMFNGEPSSELVEWIERWGAVINNLVIPRTPDPVYPEFETAEARAYFTAKKQITFGSFETLLSQTDHLLSDLKSGLSMLVPLLPDVDKPSIDDILLFPVLRSLTVMDDIKFPPAVQSYCDEMSRMSDIPLVWELRKSKS